MRSDRGKKVVQKKLFRIKILEALVDGFLYSFQYFFLEVTKLHVFRIKILGTV
jgi:hypothetical protein